MLSTEQCKKILFNLGIEFGVSPALISTRMLSDQDKCDMLNGDLTIDDLRASVEASKASGMFETYTPLKDGIGTECRNPQTAPEAVPLREKCHYRPPFSCHPLRLDCHCRQEKPCR